MRYRSHRKRKNQRGKDDGRKEVWKEEKKRKPNMTDLTKERFRVRRLWYV